MNQTYFQIEQIILKQTANYSYKTQPENEKPQIPNRETGKEKEKTTKSRYYGAYD